MIADPLHVQGPTLRMTMLAELTRIVTLAPWQLSKDHHARAAAAGLTDEDVLQAIMLSAYFGHLNRIADATAVPLDYLVRAMPPAIDRTAPALVPAPELFDGPFAIDPGMRPATQAAMATWADHVLVARGALSYEGRTAIAARAAALVGAALDTFAIDGRISDLTSLVALAPWAIDDASFAPLRHEGASDELLFDVCVVASTANMRGRIVTALRALARP